MKGLARRLAPVILAVVTLVALGWIVSSSEISSHASPIPQVAQSPQSHSAEPTPTDSQNTNDAAASRHTSMPNWLAAVLNLIVYSVLALLVLALLVFVLYRLLTSRPAGWNRIETRTASRVSAEEVQDAVQAGITEIDAGGDARAAVIECWLRLEAAAHTAGVDRLVSQTPTDLVLSVVAAHNVNDRALNALVHAYHQARYAPHDIGEELRDAARRALSEVNAQLLQAMSEEATT